MHRSLIAALAATGLGLAAVAGTATAAADPDPAPALPVPEEGAPPPPAPNPVYDAAAESRQNPVGAMADLIGSPNAMVMALNDPAAPGADPLASSATLFPQYYRMPTADMESPYLLTENAAPGPFARVDAFKGVHALLHGALGRMPADQLGQPLPGTAPPPGTNVPVGPEQFLPDPTVPLPLPLPTQIAPPG